jgi:hypothetical protein
VAVAPISGVVTAELVAAGVGLTLGDALSVTIGELGVSVGLAELVETAVKASLAVGAAVFVDVGTDELVAITTGVAIIGLDVGLAVGEVSASGVGVNVKASRVSTGAAVTKACTWRDSL